MNANAEVARSKPPLGSETACYSPCMSAISMFLTAHLAGRSSNPAGNLAFGKLTGQSSNYVDTWDAQWGTTTGWNAVDGITSGNWFEHPCTHTKREDNPYWW
eukprot:350499-Chlamydomonas_euryale.AAC.14